MFVVENDIAAYTMKAVEDPRTLNKILYVRPPANVVSHNELISMWEKKTGRTLQKEHVPEEDILKWIKGTGYHRWRISYAHLLISSTPAASHTHIVLEPC